MATSANAAAVSTDPDRNDAERTGRFLEDVPAPGPRRYSRTKFSFQVCLKGVGTEWGANTLVGCVFTAD